MKSSWITPISLASLLLLSLDSRASRHEGSAHDYPMMPESYPVPAPVQAIAAPVSGEALFRAEQLLNNPWTVGQETPNEAGSLTAGWANSQESAYSAAGPATSLPSDFLAPFKAPVLPSVPPIPDRLSEIWFVQNALALGLLASYTRSGGRDVNDGNVLGYLPTNTDLRLQLCLTYWLSNSFYLTPALLYSRNAQVQRIGEDDRYLTANTLYGLSIGAGYFKPCFTRFGMMTGADLSYQVGRAVNKVELAAPNSETKTTSGLWEAQASGYLGVWYAMNRFLVTAQLGLIAYRYRNSERYGDLFELEYRQRESEFLLGLDTKQFALGLRYLLNKRNSSSQ